MFEENKIERVKFQKKMAKTESVNNVDEICATTEDTETERKLTNFEISLAVTYLDDALLNRHIEFR